jgi:Carboxypeptidase regulatory-like domain
MRPNIPILLRFVAWMGCLGIVTVASSAQQNGTIAGTVLDRNGSAISHAKVTAQYVCLTACVMATALPQTQTDEQGHYELKRLQYGRYSVSAEKPEDDYPPLYLLFYCPEKQPEIDVSETNKTVTLDLTLTVKAGVLVGTVANSETGDPLDANVEFRSTTDPRRSLSGSGLTNARFRVLVPSDTPVVMKVSKPGYDDWFFTRDGVITPIQLGPGETLELEIKLRKASPQSSSTR